MGIRRRWRIRKIAKIRAANPWTALIDDVLSLPRMEPPRRGNPNPSINATQIYQHLHGCGHTGTHPINEYACYAYHVPPPAPTPPVGGQTREQLAADVTETAATDPAVKHQDDTDAPGITELIGSALFMSIYAVLHAIVRFLRRG